MPTDDKAKPAHPVRPKPVLYVKFTGGRVSLQRVSLSMLSSALVAIGKLSAPSGPTVRPTQGEPLDPGTFQLIGARAGSAIYAFGGRDSGLERLRLVGLALERPSEVQDVELSYDAIRDLSSIAARLRCRVLIAGKMDGRLEVLARIGPRTAAELGQALFIQGETSIFGMLQRVGGASRMNCSIRLPAREKLLYCRVHTQELARKLGRCLYEPVVLFGEATWLRSDWSIARFLVRSHSQPKQGKLIEAFEEVRGAGGHGWDAIADPEAFLDHDRGGE